MSWGTSSLAWVPVVLAATLSPQSMPPRSGSASGVVVDNRGAPMPNWIVVVRSVGSSVDPVVLRVISTDSTGAFRVDGLAPGLYSVATAPGGFNGQRRNGVVVASGGTVEVSLAVSIPLICECVTEEAASAPASAEAAPSPPSTSIVTGRVMDRQGSAIPFARVTIGSYSGFADIAGRYRAVMPAGARVMVVSAPAFQPATRDLMLRPDTTRDEDVVLEVDASADAGARMVDERLSVRVCRCGDPYGVDPLDENGRVRPYDPPSLK